MKAELEALGEDGTLPVVAVYDNIRNELNELNALMGGATTYNLSFAQPTVEDKLVRREVTVSFTCPITRLRWTWCASWRTVRTLRDHDFSVKRRHAGRRHGGRRRRRADCHLLGNHERRRNHRRPR